MSEWPPTPSSPRPHDRSGWVPTLALAAAMFGWMLVLLFVGAVTPDINLLPTGQPLEVGMGVTIFPTAGWSWGSDPSAVDPDGVEAIVIQKAGVRAFFIVGPFEGSTEEFHRLSLEDLGRDLDMFEALLPVEVAVGMSQAGLRSAFRGWAQKELLEGVLASLSYRGSGISCLALGRSGQASAILPDLEHMLQTMRLSR